MRFTIHINAYSLQSNASMLALCIWIIKWLRKECYEEKIVDSRMS